MENFIDSDSETFEKNQDLENYKGIFYNIEENEEVLNEFGAHFSYKDMFKRLELLKTEIEKENDKYDLFDNCTDEKNLKNKSNF